MALEIAMGYWLVLWGISIIVTKYQKHWFGHIQQVMSGPTFFIRLETDIAYNLTQNIN